MKKILPLLFIAAVVIVFFWQFFLKGFLPIPSDTIVGLYHPFRDLYAKDYPNGIPFKNFLITDPVRQQYPWKELAASLMGKKEFPLWNPYSMAGTPLLANFQSGSFYPLNILFFLLPFSYAWSILVFLGPLLGGAFLYLYLDNLRLERWASLLGALSFAFSGFFVAWMEWGTVIHTALWLPLILLFIDKVFLHSNGSKILNIKYQKSKIHIKNQKLLFWSIVLIFSLSSSFFAGHLQTFFYLLVLSIVYFLARWVQFGRNKRQLLLFTIYYLLFTIVTSVQWFPTLRFILLSGRNLDQSPLATPGWFLPWQNLVQFLSPDFFGNPTTLNYWGTWNYAELVGYIGILPLILALFALFSRHDKKTLFYGTVFFASLIFSLPTVFAKLPYILNIPFVSTAQPTRLLFLTDFSLAILTSLGFDLFLRHRKSIVYPLSFLGLMLASLWLFTVFGSGWSSLVTKENLMVSQRNLIFPTGLFAFSAILIFLIYRFSKTKITLILRCIIVGLIVFDLLRFGLKFTPFIESKYLFPQTKTLSFLQNQKGQFRIMTTDSRILPPNFSIMYKLQSVDGYDPLYLSRYAELVAASERGEPNISPPFGFNRIITPHNLDSKIIDLLGVKYILSLSDLSSPKLKKVFQEGQTRVYQNKDVLPRAFFVERLMLVNNKNDAIKVIFEKDFDSRVTAVVEFINDSNIKKTLRCLDCNVQIASYTENKVVIKTENKNDGFLVLTDTFYPTWKALIDGKETKIFRSDFNFRGVVVPKGHHEIVFYDSLF